MVFAADILKGKTAIVTGGATGIGSCIVALLGNLGAQVSIISRKEENLKLAAERFKMNADIDVLWRVADVRDPEGIKVAIDSLAEEMAGLDVLVCNAAGNFICPTEEMSANAWRTVVDIDLNGTFHCCTAALPYLKEAASGGRIISISTTYANKGWPGAAHAGSAKAGVQTLMRTLSVEWGPYGIRANIISPGPIAGTEGVDRLFIAEGRAEEILTGVPLGTFGEGNDIANAVTFLVSDAGKYISGAELAIDGAAQWA